MCHLNVLKNRFIKCHTIRRKEERRKKFLLLYFYLKKADVEYAYGWNRYTMAFLGIWPKNRSFNQASNYIVLVPVLTMLCFVTIPQSANLPKISHDFDLLIENLAVANVTITISILKTIIIWSKGGRKYINFYTKILVNFLISVTFIIILRSQIVRSQK